MELKFFTLIQTVNLGWYQFYQHCLRSSDQQGLVNTVSMSISYDTTDADVTIVQWRQNQPVTENNHAEEVFILW